MGTAIRLGTGATDGTVSQECSCTVFGGCCCDDPLHTLHLQQQQHVSKGIIEKMDSVHLNVKWHVTVIIMLPVLHAGAPHDQQQGCWV
jgi:hypothetical protein